MGMNGGAFSAQALSVTTATTASAIFTASLKCWHDNGQGGTQADVEAGTTLWAHKAASVDKLVTP
jgi:hypothetical protein